MTTYIYKHKRNVTTMRSPEQYKSLKKLANDLGWDAKRLEGFCRRTCHQPEPRTQRACQQVYQGLEQMLVRLMRPHWPAFDRLVTGLLGLRRGMTQWERSFLPNIAQRREKGQFVSPQMVKKVREIAHKYDVDCGWPSFRELSAAADAQRQQQQTARNDQAVNE